MRREGRVLVEATGAPSLTCCRYYDDVAEDNDDGDDDNHHPSCAAGRVGLGRGASWERGGRPSGAAGRWWIGGKTPIYWKY